MNSIIFFLSMLGLTANASLNSGGIEAIKLLGKGVINRTTGDFIGIACVGPTDVSPNVKEPSCSKLQHVIYTKSKNQLTYVGKVTTVSNSLEGTPDQITDGMKQIMKAHKVWVRKQKYIAYLSGELPTKVAFLTVCTGVPLTIVFAPWIGIGLVIAGAVILTEEGLTKSSITGIHNRSTKILQASTDQSGWNWILLARKIKPLPFQNYLKWVEGQCRFDPYSETEEHFIERGCKLL